VFVRDSTAFRRFEDDLISDVRWQDKDALLREIGSPILLTPIRETLTTFHETLETKFNAVNQRIAEGFNTHIKISGTAGKRRWTLIYPNTEEPVNSPFYSQLPGIGIADLLWFVAVNTGFLQTFIHVLDRYVKHEPNPREILACVVAMGTNMGLWKMADVSGLGHSSWVSTARNYLRLETLHAANDAISNAIAALPAFHLYTIRDETHSSSDGQRMETQIDTINARHSPKYFGLQKGVSSYTLVANHVPINAKIIGTHEHESHCSTCCTTIPRTSSRNGIRPTRTAPTKSTSGFCTHSATASPPVTAICTRRSIPWSGPNIPATMAISSSNRRGKRTAS
jgi:hypothetical protein